MNRTSVRAELNLKKPTVPIVIQNINTDTNSNFADINNLKNVVEDYNKFLTLEHNINILDESLDIIDDNYKFSYFSNNLSNDDCTTNNSITINLQDKYNVPALSLDLGDNSFLHSLKYNYLRDNVSISSQTITPSIDKEHINIDVSEDNINSIVITFTKTRFPRMFTRLQQIYFGIVYDFFDKDIVSCNVKEFVHPISTELRPNTCELSIYSEDEDFDLINSEYFRYLKKDLDLRIYAKYNDTEYIFGIYYLDNWNVDNPKEIKFNAISQLDKLNNITCYDGWYCNPNSENTYTIFKKLFDESDNLTIDYELSEELKQSKLMGIIPLDNYKNVVHLIAFCSNLAVKQTREGKLSIYKYSSTNAKTISPDVIFEGVKVTKNELPTKVNLKYYSYDSNVGTLVSDLKNVLSVYIEAGIDKQIILENPSSAVYYKPPSWSDYSSSPEFITTPHSFVLRNPSETGIYRFKTVPYIIETSTSIHSISNNLDQSENIIDINNSNLLYATGGNNVAGGGEGTPIQGNDTVFLNNLKNYYSNCNYTVEFDFLNDGTIQTGDYVSVVDESGNVFKGHIVEQNINLGGGIISHAKLVGRLAQWL